MDKSIINRIKALEERKKNDLVIYAITDKGELAEGRVKDIISEEGELKEGFSGIGCIDKGIVKNGSNLKDLDRVLKCLMGETLYEDCTHNES